MLGSDINLTALLRPKSSIKFFVPLATCILASKYSLSFYGTYLTKELTSKLHHIILVQLSNVLAWTGAWFIQHTPLRIFSGSIGTIAILSSSFYTSPTLAASSLLTPSTAVSLIVGLSQVFSTSEAILTSTFLSNAVILCLCAMGKGPIDIPYLNGPFSMFGSSSFISSIAAVAVLTVASRKRTSSLNPLLFLLAVGASFFVFNAGSLREIPRLIGVIFRKDRIAVMIQWLSVLLVTASVTWFFVSSPIFGPETSQLMLQLKRKFYHAIAVLLFMGVSMNDSSFLMFSISIAISLFILVEAFRLFCFEFPMGSLLSQSMSLFAGDLDKGQAILSHLWLLLGCALPVYLSSPSALPLSRFCGLSGILSLGFLDSAAAVFGTLLGGPRWAGSKKTFSGSLAAFACHLTAQILTLSHYNQASSSKSLLIPALVNSLISTLWEASSDQNDNMFLPLISFSAVASFG